MTALSNNVDVVIVIKTDPKLTFHVTQSLTWFHLPHNQGSSLPRSAGWDSVHLPSQ